MADQVGKPGRGGTTVANDSGKGELLVQIAEFQRGDLIVPYDDAVPSRVLGLNDEDQQPGATVSSLDQAAPCLGTTLLPHYPFTGGFVMDQGANPSAGRQLAQRQGDQQATGHYLDPQFQRGDR